MPDQNRTQQYNVKRESVKDYKFFFSYCTKYNIISKKYNKIGAGLNRDDDLIIFKNITGPELVKSTGQK